MAEEFRTPQSANEAILQNMLGAENELREPQSVVEDLLQQILEQGQGGGGDLYAHNIKFKRPDSLIFSALIVERSGVPFTIQSLRDYLINNNLTTINAGIPANGSSFDSTNGVFSTRTMYAQSNTVAVNCFKFLEDGRIQETTKLLYLGDSNLFTDTVIKI